LLASSKWTSTTGPITCEILPCMVVDYSVDECVRIWPQM
jgi:hypothetical protein